jgi:nicotine blue oxidoreductase
MMEHVVVAGLIPAAGSSRRLGTDKRLLPWPTGGTLLEATLRALADGGAAPIVVVLEPGSPCHRLRALAGATIATNPEPERGMLSSVRVGLAALPAAAAAVAVLPGDHPFAPPAAIAALIAHYRAERPLLLAPRYAGRRGHPLVVDRSLLEEARACDDIVGLQQLLERRAADLRELAWDGEGAEQADADLDTTADLHRLAPRGGAR